MVSLKVPTVSNIIPQTETEIMTEVNETVQVRSHLKRSSWLWGPTYFYNIDVANKASLVVSITAQYLFRS